MGRGSEKVRAIYIITIYQYAPILTKGSDDVAGADPFVIVLNVFLHVQKGTAGIWTQDLLFTGKALWALSRSILLWSTFKRHSINLLQKSNNSVVMKQTETLAPNRTLKGLPSWLLLLSPHSEHISFYWCKEAVEISKHSAYNIPEFRED